MSDKEILVIDDDLAILDMITELLGYEGYQVATSTSGSEALLRATSRPPALILLDLMMPVMDGWELHAALKSHPELSAVPIVVLSCFDRYRIEPALDGRQGLEKALRLMPDVIVSD